MSCSDDPIKYTLTTSVNPVDSGFVNPNGGTVDEGQQISVTATPAAEYVFDKWTGAAFATSTTVSVIMNSNCATTLPRCTSTVHLQGVHVLGTVPTTAVEPAEPREAARIE